MKNSYVGRTFIKPSQDERTKSVNIKLNPVREEIEGKRVVMVDDSIVRSTTCRRIVAMLKEAGAKEVHVAISSPPFRHPCYFGTDIPSREELIATHYDVDGICRVIGADSLAYLDFDDLPSLLCGKPNTAFVTRAFRGTIRKTLWRKWTKRKNRKGKKYE